MQFVYNNQGVAGGADVFYDNISGFVGIGTTGPQTTLQVNGGIQIADDSTECSPLKAGAIRYHDGNLEYCDGSEWKMLVSRGTLGSESNPGQSCKQILDSGSSTGSGVYWIDPDGTGTIAAFQAYCDMVTDSGGWTFVGNWGTMSGYNMYSYSGNGRLASEVKDWPSTKRPAGSGSGQGPCHYSSAVINALFHNGQRQYLSLSGRDGGGAGGNILTKHTKTNPDLNFNAYQGVYWTQYTASSGFTAVMYQTTFNGNPLPMASPSWSSVSVTGRTCSAPPSGIDCYHYLPDDITGGGQWLFRENMDNTPFDSYSQCSNVPSLLFIR